MAVRDLIDFIQTTFPPTEKLPDHPKVKDTQQHDIEDETLEQLPPNLTPIGRDPIPDWIQPQQTIRLPTGTQFLLEGQVPSMQPIQQVDDIDALAYYIPFHFYRRRWGIYMRAGEMLFLASMIADGSSTNVHDLLSLAQKILLQHEQFHFLSEVACSRAEVTAGQVLYRPYFLNGRATSLEEGLANARSFRLALQHQSTAIRETVSKWMLSQGPGYRDFKTWLTTATLNRGCCNTTGYMIRPIYRLTGREPADFLYAGLVRVKAPTYLVLDVAAIKTFKPFPKYAGMRIFVHTKDHPPPHLHVQIPPGRNLTRLQWPHLEPLKSDPPLSRDQKLTLNSYLAKYGEQIGRKIREVYGDAS